MSLFMFGCASNGFVVLVLQIIVLLVMDRKNVVEASYVYFYTTAVILICCLVLFRKMLKFPLIARKLSPKTEKDLK